MTEQLPLPSLLLAAQPGREMPELPSLRKLLPHSTFWPTTDPPAALACLPENFSRLRCLSGEWHFQLFDRPGDLTLNALATGTRHLQAEPGNRTSNCGTLQPEPSPNCTIRT